MTKKRFNARTMHCFPSPNHVGPAVVPPATAGFQPKQNPYFRISDAGSGPNNAIDNYLKPRTTCLSASEMASFESCAQRRQQVVAGSLGNLKNAKMADALKNPVYGLTSTKTSFI